MQIIIPIIILWSSNFLGLGWAISLSWPGDGGIKSGENLQVSWDGGTSPYLFLVFKLNVTNGDSKVLEVPGINAKSYSWILAEPPGSIIRFNITSANGETITSFWQRVYGDSSLSLSSVSAASTLSVASALSTQAYVSRLIISAQAARSTSLGTGDDFEDLGTTRRTNIGLIIGVALGGVVVLTAIGLLVFRRLRRARPRSAPESIDGNDSLWDNPTVGGPPTIVPYNLYEEVPTRSMTPASLQYPQHHSRSAHKLSNISEVPN